MSVSAIYTQDTLKLMKGQAVKDIWHAMIGKSPGIKNTTGLKNGEEIIQAILEGQRDPEFLQKFVLRAPKQSVEVEKKEMPTKSGNTEEVEKKKRGPKPKAKEILVSPPVMVRVGQVQAYESPDIPIRPSDITRISVKKLFVGDTLYFLETKTNKLFTCVEGKPGTCCGSWNPQTREVQ